MTDHRPESADRRPDGRTLPRPLSIEPASTERSEATDWLRRLYAPLLAVDPPTRAHCVSPDALVTLVRQHGPEADRLATLDHAVACDPCRRELALVVAAAAAARDAVA